MREQLQLAAASNPSDFEVHMAYGRALRDNHNLIPAAQQFAAAAKLRPDSVPAWNELASALIVSEDYANGLAALDRIRALGKESPGDFFFRAISLDKLKRKPEAVAAYQQFLATDGGLHPDQEFQARQRIRIMESELKK
jgi:cytochrome c-type biogenesis protein CcmH/NrfG